MPNISFVAHRGNHPCTNNLNRATGTTATGLEKGQVGRPLFRPPRGPGPKRGAQGFGATPRRVSTSCQQRRLLPGGIDTGAGTGATPRPFSSSMQQPGPVHGGSEGGARSGATLGGGGVALGGLDAPQVRYVRIDLQTSKNKSRAAQAAISCLLVRTSPK